MTDFRLKGGNGCRPRRSEQSALVGAARVRAAGEDFGESFAELKGLVRGACARCERWEARVAAGIRAVLEYASTRPEAARALTVQARRDDADGDRQAEVLAYFSGLLGAISPVGERSPISTDEGIVDSIAAVIRGHLLSGTPEELPGLASDLLYLALMPYLGRRRTILAVAREESLEHRGTNK